MKIILEVHSYAPELNKAYIGPTGTKINVPGCTTIGQVRKTLFAPLKYTGRYVILRTEYPSDKAWLNRFTGGFCNDMQSMKGALTFLRNRLDYRFNPVVKIQTKLIG